MTGTCRLDKGSFPSGEELLLEYGKLKAYQFRYPRGVEALRLENPWGCIVLLPYQGQQVWDAVFFGRSLKMKNFFDEPVFTNDLLDSYGAFIYHCGARRMGAPGLQDDHPLHGELPGAFFDEAQLEFGSHGGRNFMALSGRFSYTRAFGDKYQAVPSVRLYDDSCILDVDIAITNLASKPMDMMYMCHINFLPGANAEIVQAARWTAQDMEVRSSIPSHVTPTPEFLGKLEDLKQNPGKTRILRPEDSFDPEVVFFIRNLKTDAGGFTHMLQKHQDRTADYVGYKPAELDHTARWILIHNDHKVNAIALPATSGPEGYTREKQKGTVKVLSPGETRTFSVRVGALPPDEAVRVQTNIESLK